MALTKYLPRDGARTKVRTRIYARERSCERCGGRLHLDVTRLTYKRRDSGEPSRKTRCHCRLWFPHPHAYCRRIDAEMCAEQSDVPF